MAHFAELDQNKNVLRVVVVGNEMLLDADGKESEVLGIAFCQRLFGENTIWIQTSYNRKFRKNYAGVGCVYDAERDAFIPPQPEGDGWVLDDEMCIWRNPAKEAEDAVREAARQQIELGVTRV